LEEKGIGRYPDRLEILEKNGWSNMDLADCIVISKLHSCHTDETENEEVGEIFWRNDDSFPIKAKEDGKKREGGKGQTNEDQFSREEPNVKKGLGHDTRDPPKRRSNQDIEVAVNLFLFHQIQIMT
jgi:hypothetical protein